MIGPRTIILIPTYNEKENIQALIPALAKLYPDAELWVIDDSSPDGTGAVVQELSKAHPQTKLIVRTEKNGLGEAYKHALRMIQGKSDIHAVVTMDADGSHDHRSVGELLAALERADLAVGSRYVPNAAIEGWDKKRLLLSRGGNFYVRTIARFPIRDATAGFIAMKRSALDKVDLSRVSSSGYSYQIEFKNALLDVGATFEEVPITFRERKIGTSKVSGHIVAEGILTPLHLLMGKIRRTKLRHIAVAALFVMASCFSFYKLSESPSVWYDEGVYYQLASHVAAGLPMGLQVAPGVIQRVSQMSVGFPFIYPLAAFLKLFGMTSLNSRIFMALSILALLAFAYALARRSFSWGIALFSLALLALFPPLYGNGKSVLGEVPGLMYLVAALFALQLGMQRNKKWPWFVCSGLCTGLAAVTKPIFILILPAMALAFFVAWRRRTVTMKEVFAWAASLVPPFIVWILTQFQHGDTFKTILSFYSNPQPGGHLVATIIQNARYLLTDVGLLYLTGTMVVWTLAIIIRARIGPRPSPSEIAAYAFSVLIVAAFFRTAGYYRYLFPAQIVSLIYLANSVDVFFAYLRSKWRLSVLFQLTLLPLGVMALFVLSAYQLMFNSWVAGAYGSHKTAFWEQYFAVNDPANAFYYDVPEVAMFTHRADFYQFTNLAPAAGITAGKDNIARVEQGAYSTVIMQSAAYKAAPVGEFKLYHVDSQPYKYTILKRNEDIKNTK